MTYAVIDTNVVVASLLTRHHDSATARVMDAIYSRRVVPLLDDGILAEYANVLHRPRLCLDGAKCDFIVSLMGDAGLRLAPQPSGMAMADEKDRVFFEVALAGRDRYEACLVTGNMKHYPPADFVLTPAQFCEAIGI